MPKSVTDAIKDELNAHAHPEKRKVMQGYFKAGKGEYAEGDEFMGVYVPEQRVIAKKYYKKVSLSDIESLLHEKAHEYRLTALYTLILMYEKMSDKRPDIVALYLRNTKHVNNWDLVDTSAPKILGPHLLETCDTAVLYEFARSNDLWKQRIAIMSTLAFIRTGKYDDTLEIAKILLHHKHDLIHKAVGWMLRVVGDKDRAVEIEFLKAHYREMPRTMLRYAIEKFDKPTKEGFMKGTV